MNSLVPIEIGTALEGRLGVPIWTRRDGTQLFLDDMQDKHIEFALAILGPWRRDCRGRGERRMVKALTETIDMFRREQRRRRKAKKHEPVE